MRQGRQQRDPHSGLKFGEEGAGHTRIARMSIPMWEGYITASRPGQVRDRTGDWCSTVRQERAPSLFVRVLAAHEGLGHDSVVTTRSHNAKTLQLGV